MKRILALAASVLMSAAISATAATVEFVPPNDTDGRVFTTDRNDGWSSGRGIGFNVNADTTISSVGVFHDLTGIDLSFKVSEISASNGSFTEVASLRSGGSNVTTNGLEWIDYSFSALTLTAGTNYLIEFMFSGNGNQNFFYDNDDVAWDQDGYTMLDGTLGSSFSNTVVAAFRVDGAVAPVPVPASLPLLLAGFGAFYGIKRRKKAA